MLYKASKPWLVFGQRKISEPHVRHSFKCRAALCSFHTSFTFLPRSPGVQNAIAKQRIRYKPARSSFQLLHIHTHLFFFLSVEEFKALLWLDLHQQHTQWSSWCVAVCWRHDNRQPGEGRRAFVHPVIELLGNVTRATPLRKQLQLKTASTSPFSKYMEPYICYQILWFYGFGQLIIFHYQKLQKFIAAVLWLLSSSNWRGELVPAGVVLRCCRQDDLPKK